MYWVAMEMDHLVSLVDLGGTSPSDLTLWCYVEAQSSEHLHWPVRQSACMQPCMSPSLITAQLHGELLGLCVAPPDSEELFTEVFVDSGINASLRKGPTITRAGLPLCCDNDLRAVRWVAVTWAGRCLSGRERASAVSISLRLR